MNKIFKVSSISLAMLVLAFFVSAEETNTTLRPSPSPVKPRPSAVMEKREEVKQNLEQKRERFKRLRIGTLVTLYFNVLTSETLETSLVLQAEPAAGTDQENRKAFTLTTSNALAALN